jgi:hypothetical protein
MGCIIVRGGVAVPEFWRVEAMIVTPDAARLVRISGFPAPAFHRDLIGSAV